MQFSVGVNYWPRRSAMAMWRRFDPGEISEDFGHIASLGLDTVRIFLRWDDFQPRPDHLDAAMLERLETVAALAHDAKLGLMPTLCCGHAAETNWLPRWAVGRTPATTFPTIAGDEELPLGAGDLYSGPLLEAQLVFARAAGERLRDHPALVAWDIGNRFSDVREPRHGKLPSGEHASEPAAERELAGWSRRLADAVRAGSSTPVTAGTHEADVTRDRDVRLSSLCAPLTFASMQGDTTASAFARSRLDLEAVPFLAMLAASFSYKPVRVSSFGNPACPPQKFSAFERFALPGEPPNFSVAPDDTAFATYPCLTDDENAAACAGVLERLHADGRLGAAWRAWSDYGEHLREQPPFDRAPQELSCGIVRIDGTEKPVAAALAAFAAQRREVVSARDMPMISSTYYYRTLPVSTRTLYDAFLAFVAERRGV